MDFDDIMGGREAAADYPIGAIGAHGLPHAVGLKPACLVDRPPPPWRIIWARCSHRKSVDMRCLHQSGGCAG